MVSVLIFLLVSTGGLFYFSGHGSQIPDEDHDEKDQFDEVLLLYDVAFTQKKYGPVNVLIQHEKGYKDPIYLITNLEFPDRISQLYKKRFKIETFFSDQKSRGFHIQRSRIGKPQRLAKLLIATCLAYILCILAGIKCLQSKFYPEVHRTDGELPVAVILDHAVGQGLGRKPCVLGAPR